MESADMLKGQGGRLSWIRLRFQTQAHADISFRGRPRINVQQTQGEAKTRGGSPVEYHHNLRA
jgi:hypothetical protein